MAQQGKRLKAAYTGFDREKTYALDEAVKLARGAAKAKFDETIEISMNLGIDPRHADQMVRGVVGLPHGTGKTVRIGVLPVAPRLMKPRPPARMLSVRMTWRPWCRKARSNSIAASRPLT